MCTALFNTPSFFFLSSPFRAAAAAAVWGGGTWLNRQGGPQSKKTPVSFKVLFYFFKSLFDLRAGFFFLLFYFFIFFAQCESSVPAILLLMVWSFFVLFLNAQRICGCDVWISKASHRYIASQLQYILLCVGYIITILFIAAPIHRPPLLILLLRGPLAIRVSSLSDIFCFYMPHAFFSFFFFSFVIFFFPLKKKRIQLAYPLFSIDKS
jgi:hypothetical protein